MPHTITTNGHSRLLFSWHDLPSDRIRAEFDYVLCEECTETWRSKGIFNPHTPRTSDAFPLENITCDPSFEPRFFNYRGGWYDVRDCEYTYNENSPLSQWDGFFGESYWTAVVFRYVKNSEYSEIVAGYYQDNGSEY